MRFYWLAALWALCMLVNAGTAPAGEAKPAKELPPSIVEALIKASADWKTLEESAILKDIKIADYDLEPLAQYVIRHPDADSLELLFLLRKVSPPLYGGISARTKAALFTDALRRHSRELGWLHCGGQGSNYEPGAAIMQRSEGTDALLELPSEVALPFLRDLLLHMDVLLVDHVGRGEISLGNVAFWFSKSLLGEETSLGKYSQRRELSERLVGWFKEHRDSGGKPLPEDIVATLTSEAAEGKSFAESSALWRLYDGNYDLSSLVELIGKHPDSRSYHMLMALRYCDAGRYYSIDPNTRAKVLISALPNVKGWSADWGLVWPFWGPVVPESPHELKEKKVLPLQQVGKASLALIELGPVALERLEALKATLPSSSPDTDSSRTDDTKPLIYGSLIDRLMNALRANAIAPWENFGKWHSLNHDGHALSGP